MRSREASKPREWWFNLSPRFKIRHAARQLCCRTLERSDSFKLKYRGFEALRDLAIRRLIWYWNGSYIALCSDMLPSDKAQNTQAGPHNVTAIWCLHNSGLKMNKVCNLIFKSKVIKSLPWVTSRVIIRWFHMAILGVFFYWPTQSIYTWW